MNPETIADRLRLAGWTPALKQKPSFVLPANFLQRYPRLPEDLVGFLARFSSCVGAEEKSWFLCESDFAGTSDSAFRCDEWERLSLDAAADNPASVSAVRSFWNKHFPFLLSVRSGYSYYAVCVDSVRFGQVVRGFEPEFEETTQVAASFDQFLARLLEARVETNQTAQTTPGLRPSVSDL